MAGQPIVCVRYPTHDLATIEEARAIMGQTVSQFTRSASVVLARAILEASIDSGIARTSWDACWIKGEVERRP